MNVIAVKQILKAIDNDCRNGTMEFFNILNFPNQIIDHSTSELDQLLLKMMKNQFLKGLTFTRDRNGNYLWSSII